MILEELKDVVHSPDLWEAGASSIVDRLFLPLSHLSYPFLLEGAHSGPDAGRFSFMGSDPFMTIRCTGREIVVSRGGVEEVHDADPFQFVRELLEPYREAPHPVIPFCGGAVGYIAYEAAGLIETLPKRKADEVDIPDIFLNFYDVVMILDSVEKKVFISSSGFPEEGKKRPLRARERADYFGGIIASGGKPGRFSGEGAIGEARSNFTQSEYRDALLKIKGYIEAGDIYQANLSQRFTAPFEGSPYMLYQKFRQINPVPFGAFLSFPELSLVSNSPERFIRLRGKRLETRPIKGTIKRGSDAGQDMDMKADLKMSPKDGAEHLMIVDLVRNDLGRVCRYGTVRVDELKRIESYANLHHMVSTVSGEIRDGVDAFDCLEAAFPGGSITGAPKVRAMEIIHELEPNPRWVYTGSIGYIGFDGGMDMNIAIRTAIVKEGKVYFSVGGGIVADSDPEAEYEETLLKGEVFLKILEDKGKEDEA